MHEIAQEHRCVGESRLGCVCARGRIQLPCWKSFPQHCELLHCEPLQSPRDLQRLGKRQWALWAPLPSWRESIMSQLVCMGNGFCPTSSLKAFRQTSNDYLRNFLTLAAVYYLSLAHHHQLTVPCLPCPPFPVPELQWLLSHLHSLCLLFHPHRLPASITIPGHILIFPFSPSESAGQK